MDHTPDEHRERDDLSAPPSPAPERGGVEIIEEHVVETTFVRSQPSSRLDAADVDVDSLIKRSHHREAQAGLTLGSWTPASKAAKKREEARVSARLEQIRAAQAEKDRRAAERAAESEEQRLAREAREAEERAAREAREQAAADARAVKERRVAEEKAAKEAREAEAREEKERSQRRAQEAREAAAREKREKRERDRALRQEQKRRQREERADRASRRTSLRIRSDDSEPDEAEIEAAEAVVATAPGEPRDRRRRGKPDRSSAQDNSVDSEYLDGDADALEDQGEPALGQVVRVKRGTRSRRSPRGRDETPVRARVVDSTGGDDPEDTEARSNFTGSVWSRLLGQDSDASKRRPEKQADAPPENVDRSETATVTKNLSDISVSVREWRSADGREDAEATDEVDSAPRRGRWRIKTAGKSGPATPDGSQGDADAPQVATSTEGPSTERPTAGRRRNKSKRESTDAPVVSVKVSADDDAPPTYLPSVDQGAVGSVAVPVAPDGTEDADAPSTDREVVVDKATGRTAPLAAQAGASPAPQAPPGGAGLADVATGWSPGSSESAERLSKIAEFYRSHAPVDAPPTEPVGYEPVVDRAVPGGHRPKQASASPAPPPLPTSQTPSPSSPTAPPSVDRDPAAKSASEVAYDAAVRPAGGRRRKDGPIVLSDETVRAAVARGRRAEEGPEVDLLNAADAADFISRRCDNWDVAQILTHNEIAVWAFEEATRNVEAGRGSFASGNGRRRRASAGDKRRESEALKRALALIEDAQSKRLIDGGW